MSEPTSSNKCRSVTDSNATQEEDGPTAIMRDDNFWFEDGNIVLIARDIEFRVYKEILAKHSPVSQDMFSRPPPVAPRTSRDTAVPIETCLVVHLSDSPKDVRHVLRVCMPETNLRQVAHPSASARIRSSIQDCLFAEVHSLGVVNLARLAGERSLLPTALLHCCMLRSATVHGFEREDGSREQLTLDDISLCFVVKSRLIRESVRIALCVFEPTASRKCKTPAEYVGEFNGLVRALQKRTGEIATADPFSPFHTISTERTGLCSQCAGMIKERDLHERRAAWDRLSEMLGIDKPPFNAELPNSEAAGTG